MLLCRFGLHRPGDTMVWNAGFHFTRCTGCGADLLRSGNRWWGVPRGLRVRWHPRTAADIFGEHSANPDARLAVRRLPRRRAGRIARRERPGG